MSLPVDSPMRPDDPPARLTDSPWFWLVLFANAALVGIALIGPKYAKREAMLERRFEVRREISRQRATGVTAPVDAATVDLAPEADPQAQDRPLLVPLGPLVALLATIDVAAVGVCVWRQLRTVRQKSANGSSPAK
jgi:hypothetical protein